MNTAYGCGAIASRPTTLTRRTFFALSAQNQPRSNAMPACAGRFIPAPAYGLARALVLLVAFCVFTAGFVTAEAGYAATQQPQATSSKTTAKKTSTAKVKSSSTAKSKSAAKAKSSPKKGSGKKSSSSKAAPAKKAPASAASTVTGPSPVEQMLRSAGRNPAAPQPESGFLLNLPATVGDGEPFLAEFAARDAQSVTFSFAGKNLRVDQPTRERFQALLPVKLDEKASSLPLTLTVQWKNGKKETLRANMPVAKRRYPLQKLTVNPKYVSPPPEMTEKIKKDRAQLRATVSKVSTRQYWQLPLARPVPGEVNSLFGARRVFNGKPMNPHRGVDFRGAQGSPIHAVEAGVVALVAEHYYGGNTVIVDHGLGVFSVYLHMSAFNVRQGQTVQRGEILGAIGATGRVTGPHLHFSFFVLGSSVNGAVPLGL